MHCRKRLTKEIPYPSLVHHPGFLSLRLSEDLWTFCLKKVKKLEHFKTLPRYHKNAYMWLPSKKELPVYR